MAAEERAKQEFQVILSRIERKYDIINVKWTDDKLFEIKFRTQIERDNEDFNALCDDWVDLFSEVTNTVWAKKISNTGPKIRFRKQYQCWTQGGKVVQKELLFDARKCRGTLDVKVLTDNEYTRRKNKHIKLGLNVVVKINFVHLHKVNTAKRHSFFVHLCEPQPEPPKPVIQPNYKLDNLVTEMVQRGLQSSKKSVSSRANQKVNKQPEQVNDNEKQSKEQATQLFQASLLRDLEDMNKEVEAATQQQLIEENLHLPHIQQDNVQLLHSLAGLGGTIKLELPQNLPQYTQVVVSDLTEPLLMCPSLMFDTATSQVIPMTTHTLPSHFVQIQSQNHLHHQ